MVCWELEVIRMFLRQVRSGIYGVFEVGRTRLERLCLSGRTIHQTHRRISSSKPFLRVFFLQLTARENFSGFTFAKAI